MSKEPKPEDKVTDQPTELSDADLDEAAGGTNWMKKAQQAAQAASNASQNLHDTAMGVIKKI